ncbi:proteinase-activated receptor 3-like isoform X2 [Betta splendens]|uniref:Proteinase-activated receptor 3-like isoform X2 n=1 Tax=Betta splendens TaxID=158456 RepID=A0A9W2XY25_BETSP|nr:proteinase-activated receptor 3-like isoform X2 [Betta splendens]
MNCTAVGGHCGPPLWYQFPVCAEAPFGFVFYFAVKVFNLAVGTPCNVLVMWHISSKKSDASTSDAFIFNLALLDAFFCLTTPLDLVNRMLLEDSHLWYFQRFAYGMKDLAPLFLVCICLDRYIAVVFPVLFTSIRDTNIRTGVSVVVWGLILAYGLGKEVMHPVKKKAFKMVLMVLVIIIATYLPSVALMPFVSYYSFMVFNCQISISVYSIMDLSCSIEPLLYLTKMDHVGGSCCWQRPSKEQHDAKV